MGSVRRRSGSVGGRTPGPPLNIAVPASAPVPAAAAVTPGTPLPTLAEVADGREGVDHVAARGRTRGSRAGWLEVAAVAAMCAPAAVFAGRISDALVLREVYWSCAVAVACFAAAVWSIPAAAAYLQRRGIAGTDRGKAGRADGAGDVSVPSALGLLVGVVYMVFIIVAQLVYAKDNAALLANYNAALMSICFMVLLGFADDVLDLPWRYKLLLPTIGSLPLLVTYHGVTSVLMPTFVRPALWDAGAAALTPLGAVLDRLMTVDTAAKGAIVDLGGFYFLYMGLLAVFSTNTINIYAGINGLEAGQSLVIAVAVATANVYELSCGAGADSPHLFSLLLALPFIAATAALLVYNAYPARVFVGDTYCYFAGMTFAVMAILGHFSKTLLLFFGPQIINFVMSLPQLAKVYPCPRHRMPNYDPATDTLVASTFTYRGADGREVQVTNFTLINAVLRITGPLHERTAVNVLLALQVASCALGLYIRYFFSVFVYRDAHVGLPHGV